MKLLAQFTHKKLPVETKEVGHNFLQFCLQIWMVHMMKTSKKLVVESLFASGWTLQWVFLLLNQNSSQTSQELETSLLYYSTENAISLASQQGLILGHKARWHLLLFTQTCCLCEWTFSAILSHAKMVKKLLHLI